MSNTRQDRRKPWEIVPGEGPVVSTAIHGGHELRPEIARLTSLSDAERLREEDPFTGDWTTIGDSRAVVNRSRFEVDLNRPRERAVYRNPTDCWGLKVWREPISDEAIERSLALYDRFYAELGELLEMTRDDFESLLLLDLHTYNHRRDGPDKPPADPEANPDINVGTASVDRDRCGPAIDRFMHEMSGFEVGGRRLEVGENVKFEGAQLVRWVNREFPDACALAIEVKKIFMDEVTGALDPVAWKEVHRALEAATAGSREVLGS